MIDFVVHEDSDGVGVVVVEGIESGRELVGWIMEQDKEIKITARSAIPIGHKVALEDYAPGDTVIKYGVDIGRMVGPAEPGGHVHTHNLKTKRW